VAAFFRLFSALREISIQTAGKTRCREQRPNGLSFDPRVVYSSISQRA